MAFVLKCGNSQNRKLLNMGEGPGVLVYEHNTSKPPKTGPHTLTAAFWGREMVPGQTTHTKALARAQKGGPVLTLKKFLNFRF